ncbi:kinase-like domain-containing protein [Melampsora americana]|nr:kinase-like domain-containing protein [Melampsora americana]
MTVTPANVTIPLDLPIPFTPSLQTKFHNNKIRKTITSGRPTKITDYQLIKEIGRGSYGTVWLSKDKLTSRVCAIKILEKRKLWLTNSYPIIKSETKIMKRLKNQPFILEFIQTFSNPKFIFLALELSELGNLNQILNQFEFFDFNQLSFYLVQISAGLSVLHQFKIIYRDLKPENVLINSDGNIKLADFGLSKDVLTSNGRTNTICGTVNYMAPEVIRGEDYSYSIDWYSLGVLIHQLYIGKIPYDIPDDSLDYSDVMMDTIVEGNLEIDPFIDPLGQSFLKWLTHMDPEKRPQSIDELQSHPWVSDLRWDDIINKKVQPPHISLPRQRSRSNSVQNQADHSEKFQTKDYEIDIYGATFSDF